MEEGIKYPPIGIAGAARVGKDTLCKYLKQHLNEKYQLNAERISIAGDSIKKDLYSVIKNKTNISTFTTDNKEKTVIRPILVEYGRLMRKITKGRYFITKLTNDKTFGLKIPIITDIRYAEYPEDELYWLKTETKGLLIFLEREGIENANMFENKNNDILKQNADLTIRTKTFTDVQLLNKNMNKFAEDITKLYLNYHLPIGHLSAFK